MKKILSLVMLITMLSISAMGETFNGRGDGYLGDIRIEAEISGDKLENITVTEHHDTPRLAEAAFKRLGAEMVERQTTDVDAMAGATFSSEGFIEAVEMAVEASGSELQSAEGTGSEKGTVEDIKTDIVVIGGGGAGLTAAIQAREMGADVILVEKMPVLGGNTTYATGGLNAAETEFQNNSDNIELFYKDTMKGGRNLNNKSLVMTLASQSADIVSWLTERGADLSDVGRMGGASEDRTHRPSGGDKVGPNIIDTLSKRALEIGVDIRLLTSAVEIKSDRNGVNGIVVEENGRKYSIDSKAVIIATGGFGNNSERFAELDPSLTGFGTTNHPGATGDALDMIIPLEVSTVDLAEIQTHPTVVPVRNTMITEAVRGNGAILVSRDARRFVNELDTRDVVSEATLEQKGKTAYLLFDQGVRESLKAIEGYAKMGLLTEGRDLNALAAKLGIPAKELNTTVKEYNTYAESGRDKDFGRQDMNMPLLKAPFYAVEVGPAVHHTMGGIEINTKAEVLNTKGNIVPGLFAAGEVTGGVHGANRLGGNALTDITVYGRIAGESAVNFIK